MMKALLGATLILALATGSAGAKAPDLTVATKAGMVRGVAGQGVETWKGVPFAAPPVGAARWRAPQPVAWNGVRDAQEFGPDCMQTPFAGDIAPLETRPSEDCLTLNIWRPAHTTAKTGLPVLVWIYGGGYVNGGSSPKVYDGAAFARQGLVFVSFNYRLGRFGFFAHPALRAAHEGPVGNFGFMDQVAALRWVQDNIAKFGGDPAQVTIMGESAGGGSTLNLLTSPQAKGLFTRAIVMSGGGREGLTRMRDIAQDRPGVLSGEKIGVNFAERMGVTGRDGAALSALRALPAEKLVDGLNLANMLDQRGDDSTYVGGPMIDGGVTVATPSQVAAEGKLAPVAVMVGSTTGDVGPTFTHDKDSLFALFGAQADRARQVYDPSGQGAFEALAQAIGPDRMMNEPARWLAASVSAGGQKAYLYRYGYVATSLSDTVKAAQHAQELPFVFDTAAVPYGSALTARDQQAASLANRAFANFARTGDPNPAGAARWPTFDQAQRSVFLFDAQATSAVETDPLADRLDLIRDAADQSSPVRN